MSEVNFHGVYLSYFIEKCINKKLNPSSKYIFNLQVAEEIDMVDIFNKKKLEIYKRV